MENLFRIPEGAQDFMEPPLIIRRGADVILRYDDEQEDGRYGYKGILFHNCTEASHRPESEIRYTDYRLAYNSVASDGGCFYIFFDGFGLYSFHADGFEPLDFYERLERELPPGATTDDFVKCKSIVAEYLEDNHSDLDSEVLNVMGISYSKGGDYSDRCIRAFCKSVFERR